MLLEANEFVLRNFADGSRPSRATLMRWFSKGQIPGARKVGGKWYVDEAQFAGKQPLPPSKDAAVNKMVEMILKNS